ncbi:biotin-dependent carboxyltransferase family protein [Winogradskyella sp.]|uniref:5-oxoprolinase subunit C family protein n=1 Tax=Winogradskyella sp. TaxID=1883156 RepID=UPI00260896EA|nr:biotin-dependent carboxyltransferase family protein [Winogradskyella sp.]
MLKVLNPGFYTTMQDLGRLGFRAFGVPVSGVMDSYSSQFANALLGNNKFDAVLEMTMIGGTFRFMNPTQIVISGAYMRSRLNNKPIGQNCAIQIETDDVLSFGHTTKGFRTYLAIKGGFESETVFNSLSQYRPITAKGVIETNDVITYLSIDQRLQESNATVKYNDSIFNNQILEAYKGPEFGCLNLHQKEQLLNSELKVSKYNNRMAYQLEPLLKNRLEPILTAPVLPGTVQLTPQGNLIVLMRDAQTTGGYPRILQLSEESISLLSQKTVGNTLKIGLKDT